MIEELKMLLEAVAQIPNGALMALAGYLIYKAVLYLSTAGSLVFIAKLTIQTLQASHAKSIEGRRELAELERKPQEWTMDGATLSDNVRQSLVSAVSRAWTRPSNKYPGGSLHSSDVSWLNAAINEKIQRESEERK